jgi:hypothetical protein
MITPKGVRSPFALSCYRYLVPTGPRWNFRCKTEGFLCVLYWALQLSKLPLRNSAFRRGGLCEAKRSAVKKYWPSVKDRRSSLRPQISVTLFGTASA